MEWSRKELTRLMAYNNPHAWAVPDDDGMAHRYFSLDKNTQSKEGDTSLLRLLALHACPKTVKNFLVHFESLLRQNPQGDLFRQDKVSTETQMLENVMLQSNYQGVSPLHVALHRNSWYVGEIVRILLMFEPSLVRRRMSISGSYPLHISMANNLTIHSEALDVLLALDASVVYEEDDNGDNPVSLLYKNVLRFRWARDWEREDRAPETISGDSSWMTVITPEQYATFTISMISAAQRQCLGRTNITWRDVCAFPRCPPLLVRILRLQMNNAALLEYDNEGLLPLHHAAKAKAISNQAIPDHVLMDSISTLELVLGMQPHAARLPDMKGQFPIQYALENPTVESRVLEHLLESSPVEALMTPSINGLVPFQQAATRQECQSSVSECEGVSLVYTLLRSEPSVLLMS